MLAPSIPARGWPKFRVGGARPSPCGPLPPGESRAALGYRPAIYSGRQMSEPAGVRADRDHRGRNRPVRSKSFAHEAAMPDYSSRVPSYTFPTTIEAQKRRSPATRSCSGCGPHAWRLRTIRTGRPIIMSIRSPRSTTPTACASGRATGISSIRPIRRKIHANIGVTPSPGTSCIGAISRTASIPTPKKSASRARRSSRTTASSPCTSARRPATWWPRQAIRCC